MKQHSTYRIENNSQAKLHTEATTLAIVLLTSLSLLSQPALAGPDPHTISNGVAYFEGDQSNGISWTASASIPSIVVSNLTHDITPASGTTGIGLSDDNNAIDSSVTYVGGNQGIQTSGDNAIGIRMKSVAEDQGRARDGWYDWPWDKHVDGYTGDPGFASGNLTLSCDGEVETMGIEAAGISLVSLGGKGEGGGNGYNGADDGAGGNGGAGGSGGNIILSGSVHIITFGKGSDGIEGMSIGGAGGAGGHAYDEIHGRGGGTGGLGGRGGNVVLSGNGSIETSGDDASGIYALSAGGVGGHGGEGHEDSDGGHGGNGGLSGNIAVTSNWDIATAGLNSGAIIAQSEGGNGGAGHSNGSVVRYHAGDGGIGGNAGSVLVTGSGHIQTLGTNSSGISALSEGGMGGRGSDGFQSGDGGRGGDGGNGGEVIVNGGWTIDTTLSGSHGIIASSAGGNGNDGGNGKSDNADDGNGGSGGYGGNAGSVNFVGNALITTLGDGSYGIFAKSFGGNGGNAGEAYEDSGGRGGNGGQGGTVSINGTGSIKTTGNGAFGVYALSDGGKGGHGGEGHGNAHGGNGGNGGGAGTVAVNGIWDIATMGLNGGGIVAKSKGGSGGDGHSNGKSSGNAGAGGNGGNAGSVILTGTGTIGTIGTNSSGIIVKSEGGDGGKGDDGFQSGDGGKGGSGGTGDEVTVNGDWAITTLSNASHGISASSLGGRGGDGGGSGSDWLDDGKGANGGVGGSRGNVSVSGRVSIATTGENSHGIQALSRAGDGGHGGTTYDNKDEGGKGALGGNSGDVGVRGGGFIDTSGHNSSGILAVSRAGRGGDGGDGEDTADGGNGAAGGDASTVLVNGDWIISTQGTNSAGISAGSLGGSGGTAGAGGWDLFAHDGSSGGAGDGGRVEISFNGMIESHGQDSHGIMAQSIGGFGGDAPENPDEKVILLSFNGSGGSAGDGGSVAIENRGNVKTFGAGSHAIFAESIGGGGGSGSGAQFKSFLFGISVSTDAPQGGNGGAVDVVNSGNLFTTNNLSRGIFSQSIGGGGGDVTKTFSLFSNLGGTGGTGGDGGIVTVTNAGKVTTIGADSEGIFAQSIGGGGGAGGDSETAGYFGSVSIGGKGGSGGDAESVSVFNMESGEIATYGDRSLGIIAQSIGGGGGKGGVAKSFAAGKVFSLAVALGGEGGKGGDGGMVDIHNAAPVFTAGNNAHGIIAQSAGGGGGSGSASYAFSAAAQLSGAVSIGGKGGVAGDASRVNVMSAGDITTQGTHSYGILAQSVGGGGGDGATSIAGSAGVSSLGRAVGGSGGAGGAGSNVCVTNYGRITTQSIYQGDVSSFVSNQAPDEVESPLGSVGIFAQSIGGGGGNGGLAVAGSIALGALSVNLSSALGGEGGAGNQAGSVTVFNAGPVDTFGTDSPGIFAQSIGGGGGNGGSAYSFGLVVPITDKAWTLGVSSAVGGKGGEGGIGGTVHVINMGGVTTHGDDSHGIFAQSIGGGGGKGGSSIALSLGINFTVTGKELLLTRSLGGEGGEGNHGGSVFVDNNGRIWTLGDLSDGIHAQSIGGGGGDGGDAQAVSLNLGWQSMSPFGIPTSILKGDWMVGGNGGSGSDGGAVTITNRASVQTKGVMSRAIVAQSIGGGGGHGGDGIRGLGPGLDAAKFILDTTPYWQNWSFVVGGNGGSSGNANFVNIWNSGDLVTTNYASTAILAQSIGGGGGIAQTFYEVESSTASGGNAVAGLLGKVGIGGAGGSAGDGDRVDVFNSGNIYTGGDESHGIFAQSVGGGGGVAGNVSRMVVSNAWFVGDLNVGVGLDWGRDGGCGGNGGDVTITNLGVIETHGVRSFGIYAQSVGGGGGLAGGQSLLADGISYITDFFSGSVGGYGDSGDVRIIHHGDIITYGEASDAIFAQSVGGTNETGEAEGVGGIVQVEVVGSAMAYGTNANGIFAQSTGVNGGDNITISITNGVVQGGLGSGAGIRISGGADNTVRNYGSVVSINGADGFAILGNEYNEFISNKGVIIGSVDLGGGSNVFNNAASAEFHSGSVINLGTGNRLMNAGTLSPGGVTTLLTGDYLQTTSGVLRVDLNGTSGSDQLVVDGTATLDGTVSILNGGGVFTDGRVFEVLVSSNDLINTFSHTNLPAIKPLLYFAYEQETDRIKVTSTAHSFESVADNRLERSVGRHLNTLIPSASDDLLDVMGAFQSADADAFSDAFRSLGPSAHDATTRAAISAARQAPGNLQRRMTALPSQREPANQPTGASGPGSPMMGTEQLSQVNPNALWFSGVGLQGEQDGEDGFSGYDYRTAGFEFGNERIFQKKTMAGVGVDYASTAVDIDQNGGDSDIESIGGSLYAARYSEGWYVDGILRYANQEFDTRRNVLVGSANRTANSSHSGNLLSGSASVRYDISKNAWKVGPLAALQYLWLDEEGYSETGAGGANQIISGRTTDSLTSELGIRITRAFETKHGLLVPAFQLGWLYDFDIGDRTITSAFEGAPDTPFSVEGQAVEQNGVLLGIDVRLLGTDGLGLSLEYDAEFRQNYSVHGLRGVVHYAF